MNLDGDSLDDSLPLEIHEQIGELRERFEDACQGGQSVRIEEYFSEVEETYREALFRELLRLELDYAARRGQELDANGYIARFPEYQETIERVFDETRARAVARERQALPDEGVQ